MVESEVEAIRSFNRTVAERIGALSEEFLSRPRPLAASRLLWEIGRGPADVRDLRTRLGLDSGYLSRLLRSLEGEGLVELVPAVSDGRVRVAGLTEDGRRERSVLDSMSDDLARSFLAPLGHRQRAELVSSMQRVERLLTAGLVEIDVADPRSPDARFCLDAYFAELNERMATGFDLEAALPLDPLEMMAPRGTFLIARLTGRAVGCGGLKLASDAPPEIKRMWVSTEVRGLGVGRRILTELESCAVAQGATTVRLDSNSVLVEAVGLYRSSGYREVPPFNDEPHGDLWLEKLL